MIHILNKFQPNPYPGPEIDTTSNNGAFRWLSPFLLPAPPAKNLENLWQFSKVYPCHVDSSGNVNDEWVEWRKGGWQDIKAHRYPMGKGTIPLFSLWNGERLDYIQARKLVYTTEYARNVVRTDSFGTLLELHAHNTDVSLRDYDGYDYRLLGVTLQDVINNPKRKMGHAFVLAMIIEGSLGECLV